MPYLYRCPRCRIEWSTPGLCRSCWDEWTLPVPVSRDGIPYGAAGARPHKARKRPTIALNEGLRTETAPKLHDFGYPALQLPLDVNVIVSGPPGGGKSTFCTVMALTLALRGKPVLWLSVEEGQNPTTYNRFKMVLDWMGSPELPRDTPLISDGRTLHDVDQEIRDFEKGKRGVVFIDSLTVANASHHWFADLCFSPVGVVAISHVNSLGRTMGGDRPAYDVDVQIFVKDFTAHLPKCRWPREGAPTEWAVNDFSASPAQPRSPDLSVIPFPKEVSP